MCPSKTGRILWSINLPSVQSIYGQLHHPEEVEIKNTPGFSYASFVAGTRASPRITLPRKASLGVGLCLLGKATAGNQETIWTEHSYKETHCSELFKEIQVGLHIHASGMCFNYLWIQRIQGMPFKRKGKLRRILKTWSAFHSEAKTLFSGLQAVLSEVCIFFLVVPRVLNSHNIVPEFPVIHFLLLHFPYLFKGHPCH